jgi:hypothetical protein
MGVLRELSPGLEDLVGVLREDVPDLGANSETRDALEALTHTEDESEVVELLERLCHHLQACPALEVPVRLIGLQIRLDLGQWDGCEAAVQATQRAADQSGDAAVTDMAKPVTAVMRALAQWHRGARDEAVAGFAALASDNRGTAAVIAYTHLGLDHLQHGRGAEAIACWQASQAVQFRLNDALSSPAYNDVLSAALAAQGLVDDRAVDHGRGLSR